MIFAKKHFLAAQITALLLTGCTSDIASNEKNNEEFEKLSNRVTGEFDFNTRRLEDEPFRYSDDFHVLGGAFEMVQHQALPPAFDAPVSFKRVDEMTLDQVIDTLNKRYQKYGIVVNLDNEARVHISDNLSEEQTTTSSLGAGNDDSTGVLPIATIDRTSLQATTAKKGYKIKFNLTDSTLRQALDLITANTNTWWRFEDGRATIYRYEKETFLLDFGDRSYLSSFEHTANSGSDENSIGSGITSEGEDAKPLDQIEKQIELLLSEEGQVYVNRFEKTATVKDTPPNIKKVRKFLEDQNYRATTAYGIVVDVFEIVSEVNDDRGTDWKGVFKKSNDTISIGSPNFVPSTKAGLLDIDVSIGKWNIDAIYAALNTNASLYSHIQNTAKTKNNIPTIVTSIDDRAIVTGRSVTVNSEGFSQESSESKIIDEGFGVTTRPRITSKGRIDMEVVVNTKVIKDVKSFGNKDNEVQLEENRRQNAMGNVIMRDGDHAIVSAYERMLTSADVQSLAEQFPWWAGGRNTKKRYKANLIVVVNPTILER
ncbi:hypothetical protein [Vibrio harveyi]|uniref:hypothetical protein n=1 Tax=Vibrio harveyi TaxID=669 RepID=UPI0024815DE9|nr:hypothetical protein [Vibrio harveyi]